jgi:hypothetical protein
VGQQEQELRAEWELLRQTFKELQPTVNSYFGMMRQANCYNERKKAAEFISDRGFKFDNNLTKLIG